MGGTRLFIERLRRAGKVEEMTTATILQPRDILAIAARRDVLAGSLSYGEQRMLEFARALATKPKLFLVDEPAAGLNAAEVDTLLDRIRITRERGVTVILVEHNMELVMNVADRVLVMDYGQHLFEGVPAEVQKSEAVLAAYLGGELM